MIIAKICYLPIAMTIIPVGSGSLRSFNQVWILILYPVSDRVWITHLIYLKFIYKKNNNNFFFPF